MSTDTITRSEAQPEETGPKNFVTLSSLKNYATATASLTLVINILLYIYSAFRGKVMPLQLLIPLAIILSITYILSFFKRDKELTYAQYIWIAGMNSLMLFTSISGVNGMLDTARKAFTDQNIQKEQAKSQDASVGDFFKHLFFPTHGWFNNGEADQRETQQVIKSTISSIDISKDVIDTLLQKKNQDRSTIDTLNRQLDSLHTNYLITLDLFGKAVSSIQDLRRLLKEKNVSPDVSPELSQLRPVIENSRKQIQQQQQQQQQQQRQRQIRQQFQIQQLEQEQKTLFQQRKQLMQKQRQIQ